MIERLKYTLQSLLILNKGFPPRMDLFYHQFSIGRFYDHFRTREIWDDLMIKWLLGHCVRQHIDFSKGVLFSLQVGPWIIKIIGEIGVRLVLKYDLR